MICRVPLKTAKGSGLPGKIIISSMICYKPNTGQRSRIYILATNLNVIFHTKFNRMYTKVLLCVFHVLINVSGCFVFT